MSGTVQKIGAGLIEVDNGLDSETIICLDFCQRIRREGASIELMVGSDKPQTYCLYFDTIENTQTAYKLIKEAWAESRQSDL